MRLNIIGVSGSGKTTLAKKLSEKHNIPHYNLDYILFEHISNKKERIELEEKVWKEKLNKIIKKKDWIIEGVNPIQEVFEKADKIIFLKPKIHTALFRQWKRFLTDKNQRKEYGFKSNLKLSKYIFNQYIENEDLTRSNDSKYVRLKKLNRILQDFKSKTEYY